MKTKFLILATFFCSILLAQVEKSTEIQGHTNSYILQRWTENNQQDFLLDNDPFYGYTSSVTTENFYLAVFEFNLPNLPQDATERKCEIIYSPGKSAGTTDVKYIGSSFSSSDYEKRYSQISKSSATFSFNETDGSGFSDITDLYLGNASSGRMIFGVTNMANGKDLASISMLITYKVPVKFVVKNNFNAGEVKIDSENKPSGFEKSVSQNGTNVTLGAIENQTYGGYNYIWNDTEAQSNKSDWKEGGEFRTNSISYSFSLQPLNNGKTFEAGLKKKCNMSFTSPQSMNVSYNGQNYTGTSINFTAIEQNIVNIETPASYTSNQVKFTFKRWSDGNTSRSRSINVSAHKSVQAEYEGVADNTIMGMACASGVNEKVHLTWNEHPHPNVSQYKLYRQTKNDPAVCIATLNRGTTSYTDYAATKRTSGNELIKYSVDCYYSPSQTWSEHYWAQYEYAVLIDRSMKDNDDNFALAADIVVKENKITNFPNPFNPTTKIEYSITENSNVKIVVYNMLGQEIKTLVNGEKSAGTYYATFDASGLPSGMYYCKMVSNNFNKTIKMLLTK